MGNYCLRVSRRQRAIGAFLGEQADLAVSARTRFLGCAVMHTRVRTYANKHNVGTWYAPNPPTGLSRRVCLTAQLIKKMVATLVDRKKRDGVECVPRWPNSLDPEYKPHLL